MTDKQLENKVLALLGGDMIELSDGLLAAYIVFREAENQIGTVGDPEMIAAPEDGDGLPSEEAATNKYGFPVRRRLYVYRSEIPATELAEVIHVRQHLAADFIQLIHQKQAEKAGLEGHVWSGSMAGQRTAKPMSLLSSTGEVDADGDDLRANISAMNEAPATKITYRSELAFRGQFLTEPELIELVAGLRNREIAYKKRAEDHSDYGRAEIHQERLGQISENWAKLQRMRPLLGDFSARVQSGMASNWRAYFGPENYRFKLPNVAIIRATSKAKIEQPDTRIRQPERPYLGTVELGRTKLALFVDRDHFEDAQAAFGDLFGMNS